MYSLFLSDSSHSFSYIYSSLHPIYILTLWSIFTNTSTLSLSYNIVNSHLPPSSFFFSSRITTYSPILLFSPLTHTHILYYLLWCCSLSQRNLDAKTFLGAPPQVMVDTLRNIRAEYGGVEEYLDYIGFGKESRERLIRALTQ